MAYSRENGERRILGALAVISHQSEVLLIKDPPKVEVAGAQNSEILGWWSRTDKNTWGLPGGGRGLQPNGKEETLLRTLSSELTEELAKREGPPYRRLPSTNNDGVLQQQYPNVVAQKKQTEGKQLLIHQFGVTSVHYPHAKLSKIARADIQKSLDEERAIWMSLQTLVEIFNSDNPILAKEDGLNFRPQVLMAAYIWHLHFSGISPQQFDDTIIASNKAVINFVVNEASQPGDSIKNGSFNPDGTVAMLNKSDRLFLLGNKRR